MNPLDRTKAYWAKKEAKHQAKLALEQARDAVVEAAVAYISAPAGYGTYTALILAVNCHNRLRALEAAP